MLLSCLARSRGVGLLWHFSLRRTPSNPGCLRMKILSAQAWVAASVFFVLTWGSKPDLVSKAVEIAQSDLPVADLDAVANFQAIIKTFSKGIILGSLPQLYVLRKSLDALNTDARENLAALFDTINEDNLLALSLQNWVCFDLLGRNLPKGGRCTVLHAHDLENIIYMASKGFVAFRGALEAIAQDSRALQMYQLDFYPSETDLGDLLISTQNDIAVGIGAILPLSTLEAWCLLLVEEEGPAHVLQKLLKVYIELPKQPVMQTRFLERLLQKISELSFNVSRPDWGSCKSFGRYYRMLVRTIPKELCNLTVPDSMDSSSSSIRAIISHRHFLKVLSPAMPRPEFQSIYNLDGRIGLDEIDILEFYLFMTNFLGSTFSSNEDYLDREDHIVEWISEYSTWHGSANPPLNIVIHVLLRKSSYLLMDIVLRCAHRNGAGEAIRRFVTTLDLSNGGIQPVALSQLLAYIIEPRQIKLSKVSSRNFWVLELFNSVVRTGRIDLSDDYNGVRLVRFPSINIPEDSSTLALRVYLLLRFGIPLQKSRLQDTMEELHHVELGQTSDFLIERYCTLEGLTCAVKHYTVQTFDSEGSDQPEM